MSGYGNNNSNSDDQISGYNDYSDLYVGINTSSDFENIGQLSANQDMAILRKNYGSVQLNETVRYGNEDWIKQFYIPGVTEIKDIKADNNGDIYACGYVNGDGNFLAGTIVKGARNGFVLKMDYNKNVKWVHMERPVSSLGTYNARTYDLNGEIEYHALTCDSDGNVYAAGTTSFPIFNHTGDSGNGALPVQADIPSDLYNSGLINNTNNKKPFITKINSNGKVLDYAYIPAEDGGGPTNDPPRDITLRKIIVDDVNSSIFVLGDTKELAIGISALNTDGSTHQISNSQYWDSTNKSASFCCKLKMTTTTSLATWNEGGVAGTLTGKYWDCPFTSTEANTWYFTGISSSPNNTRVATLFDMILDDDKLWFVGNTKATLYNITGADRGLTVDSVQEYPIITYVTHNETNQFQFSDGSASIYDSAVSGQFWSMSRNARVWTPSAGNTAIYRGCFKNLTMDTSNNLYITGKTNTIPDLTSVDLNTNEHDSMIFVGKLDKSDYTTNTVNNVYSKDFDTNARMTLASTGLGSQDTGGTEGINIKLDDRNNIYIVGKYKQGGLQYRSGSETTADAWNSLTNVPSATADDIVILKFSSGADNSSGEYFNWTGEEPTNIDTWPATSTTIPVVMSLSQFVPCLLEGTIITTDQGNLPIEELTLNNTIRGIPIKKITKNKINSKHICKIPKNWFDLNKPNKDTYITKSHNICVENEKKFPKGFKRAGSFDCGNLPINLETELCTVYHISFGSKHSYYHANNLPVESLNPYFNKRY